MIKRIWHGWTKPETAGSYQRLLTGTIFAAIEAREIPGHLGTELLRREHADEVEFVVVMTFASLESVIDFQGADYTKAYVPEEAQRVLMRWDGHAAHYDVADSRTSDLASAHLSHRSTSASQIAILVK